MAQHCKVRHQQQQQQQQQKAMADVQEKQETVECMEEEKPSSVSMITSESKTSSLIAVSNLGTVEEEEEEEDGPRMGDLIRQAMPPCNKLERSPSLPAQACRINKVEGGFPTQTAITKLTRRSSLNPPVKVPPRRTSKGSTASGLSKKIQQRGSNLCLERSMSLKSLSDKEVQGFLELGFTFEKDDLSSTAAGKLSTMKISEEPAMEGDTSEKQRMKPPVPEDMKAQIKFWARAVTTNVRQECLSPR